MRGIYHWLGDSSHKGSVMWKVFLCHGFLHMIVKPQDSKAHGVNMGPTWVLSAPDGPHVGPMNLAIRAYLAVHAIQASNSAIHTAWPHQRSPHAFCCYASHCITPYQLACNGLPCMLDKNTDRSLLACNKQTIESWHVLQVQWPFYSSNSVTLRWLSARLQWLQCISNGVTAILH